MVRGYGFQPLSGGHRRRRARQCWGVGDNGGVESALLEQLVAAGGAAGESCLRWLVLGESLSADPGCLDVVWPDRPMQL